MRSPLTPLRAEARVLARQARAARQRLKIGAHAHAGPVPRGRAGVGETFWQYRHYGPDDGARDVDWRRSARGDELFVREHELERPRSWLFWFDPGPGFDWRGDAAVPRKSERAVVLIMAMAEVLTAAGDQCAGPPHWRLLRGATAAERIGAQLWRRPAEDDFESILPACDSIPVLLSDFYGPQEVWQRRLETMAARARRGLAVAIADPVETSFPLAGRTRLFAPGNAAIEPRLFGRIEAIRDVYLRRFAARRAALQAFLAPRGWHLIEADTAAPAHVAFGAMLTAYRDIRAA